MSKEDLAVYRAVTEALAEDRPCALATVLSTRGSTPRKTGAKMVVDPEKGLVGTIGGGCGEAEVIEAAKEALESGRPRIVQVNLTDDPLSWSASICGGVLDVFVEPVYPDRSSGAPAKEEVGG
jgi:xanthine dehydrogenase accessory factor